jgi:type IV secretion system protein VirD4
MNTDNLRRYVLPNLPYVPVFWFADKLGEAWRLAPGEDALDKMIYGISILNTVMANPLPSLHSKDLLTGIAGTAALYATVYFKKKNAKKWRKDREYGSARWGTPADIKPYMDENPDQNIILTATEGLTMNSRPKKPKYARNKNVLIVGGSGSGKTRFWLKPNLMQLHSSYVITDPKGTLILECGKLLQRNSYRIKILNTIDFSKSMHYNPFAYIRSEKDILKLVTALIANTKGEGKSGEDFWVKAETLLYCALIGYIHYEAPDEERNLNTLVELINAMEVREDDDTFKNAVDFMFDALEERDPSTLL